jgi:poly-gamma-glutamate capsule biosynthesis protein CapA/YwtB (metallophosphatase superfamily)
MVASGSGNDDFITLFLAGDVMTGRGIDQILPHPSDDRLHEDYVKSALEYVHLAERAHGPVHKPVAFGYIWGEALSELDRRKPDARIVNLETAVTHSTAYEAKGINYRMSPANVPVITAAGIDCCVLANNHVLDWGRSGLIETLSTLELAGVHCAGAGHSAAMAARPAVLNTGKGARILVFGFASPCSGVPRHWAASAATPGVNLIPNLTIEHAEAIAQTIHAVRRPGDVVVASIHWGRNWDYDIPEAQRRFAHRLIDMGAVDLVHGHSSHHFKGIEVYRNRPILYGCGDFIDDYEGISGYEEFRDDLVLMYFPTIRAADRTLAALEMVPLQVRNMRLNPASTADRAWVLERLERECARFETRIGVGSDGTFRLQWD